MSLTYGFFNSVGGDRKYSAEDVSRIFDGIINDGIFASVGQHFQVSATGTLRNISVGTGRAWLNSTWTLLDAAYPLTLDNTTSSSYKRIDAICIKVDSSDAVRANSIVVVKGTQSASPSKPTIPSADTSAGIYYHVLAYVTVSYNATIVAANIENAIGLSTGTPYVTGILASTSVDELWSQWDGEFNDWWETIKSILDTDTVTRLQNEIDHLKPSEETILKYFSSVKEAGDYPTDAILSQISILLGKAVTVYTGTGAPPSTLGDDGQFYLDLS